MQGMDQQQWQTTTDLDAMLQFLRLEQDKETKRQMRLFACACVRRVWPLLFDPTMLAVVEVAEKYAEGRASPDDLLAARRIASEVASATGDRAALAAREVTRNDSWSAADCAAREAATAAMFSRLQAKGGESWSRAAPGAYAAALKQYRDDERAWQCRLLRCIAGNPFDRLPAQVFPDHVVALARTISAAFPDVAAVADEYRILGDALEDMGEDLAAEHCRQPEHAQGCHIIEWIEPPQRPKRRRPTTYPDEE
jgi:hypothetical protein